MQKREDCVRLTNIFDISSFTLSKTNMWQLVVYLFKCAEIHRVKNVLCIIWMLFKRDRFLEGFGLYNSEDRKESEARQTLRLSLLHNLPLAHKNMLPPCYYYSKSRIKQKENQWRKKSWRGLVSVVIDYPIKSLSLRGSCMGGARWQAGMILKESERGSCILTTS